MASMRRCPCRPSTRARASVGAAWRTNGAAGNAHRVPTGASITRHRGTRSSPGAPKPCKRTTRGPSPLPSRSAPPARRTSRPATSRCFISRVHSSIGCDRSRCRFRERCVDHSGWSSSRRPTHAACVGHGIRRCAAQARSKCSSTSTGARTTSIECSYHEAPRRLVPRAPMLTHEHRGLVPRASSARTTSIECSYHEHRVLVPRLPMALRTTSTECSLYHEHRVLVPRASSARTTSTDGSYHEHRVLVPRASSARTTSTDGSYHEHRWLVPRANETQRYRPKMMAPRRALTARGRAPEESSIKGHA